MQGFYERNRDENTKLLVARGGEHAYSAHFHQSAEVFLVKEGRYRLTVNGESHVLSAGAVAVIEGFQVHAYERLGEIGNDCVLVIPTHYEKRFERRRQGRRIQNPVFTDAALCEELLRIVDGYLMESPSPETEQAACELLLSCLGDHLVFTQASGKEEGGAIREILTYVDEHFLQPITRKELARALGYSEAHVSRVFHRYMGLGISDYVNRLRHAYVRRLRAQNPERTETELWQAAGFTSVQTYYRTRKKEGK